MTLYGDAKDRLRQISPVTAERFAGSVIQQTWSALYWFEELFKEVPLRGVLEVGCGHGALSVFFGLHFPGAIVAFNDWDARGPHTKDLHQRLGIVFQQADALHQIVADRMIVSVPHPALVFCDNGDKPREFALYAPLLKSGDAIAVHDNGVEFHADKPEAQAITAACGLARWRKEELDADCTLLALWVKP